MARLDTSGDPLCHICGQVATLQIDGEGWFCQHCRRLRVLVTEPIQHLDGAVCDLITEVMKLQKP